MISRRTFTQRSFIGCAGLLPGVGWAASRRPDPEAILRDATSGRTVTWEGVTIEMPQLAETGNSVPITLSAQSPMTEADYVRRLSIVVPGNPEPLGPAFLLSPANGVARVSTRLRLARTQTVVVLAEHSDGRVTGAQLPVLVTLGACIDELWTD
jgi:sulfur-oxidizing protein SoxY